MTFNTKYFTGDIIASINAGNCTVEELIKRFDNHTNVILQQLVYKKVTELINKGMIAESRKGVLKCTKPGRDYIATLGYLS